MLNYVRPVRSWARASSEFRVSGKNVKTIEIERKQAVPISRKKVSDLANILPPEINPIYELRHERPNTSVQDYDAQGKDFLTLICQNDRLMNFVTLNAFLTPYYNGPSIFMWSLRG
jgi:hypothetical protein